MTIRHFYIALNSDDYLTQNHPESKYPVKGEIVSNISFQSYYFSHYIEKLLRKLKCETSDFNMILIRGRKNPEQLYFIEEHFKSLTIEVHFDEKEYRKLYPYENQYPIKRLLKPITDKEKFSEFLLNIVSQGLLKAKEQNAPIPVKELLKMMNDYKSLNFKNEWIFK